MARADGCACPRERVVRWRLSCFLAVALLAGVAQEAQSREQIRIVGSSTVYPFVTSAAEQFGKISGFKTPIVESTGTGGGIKLFCSGAGDDTPDMANASRAIKLSELELCARNGVRPPLEVKIGYDGIVFAGSVKGQPIALDKRHIFLALAKEVPVRGALAANPYRKWNDIDKSLPDIKIEVYGPPPTSGTRDSFVELVMDESCKAFKEFKTVYPDEKERKKHCQLLREDGVFIEAGENDNLIVQKLVANQDAFGIFGFSFYEENTDKVRAAAIDGTVPSFEGISGGGYSVARPLFIYVKQDHMDKIPGMRAFLQELTSDKAIGEEGYLTLKGLVPLPADMRENISNALK